MEITDKKVLIISDEDDATTEDVILWLKHFGQPFIRINRTDNFELKSISIEKDTDDFLLENENFKLCSNEIASYWYRRGRLSLNRESIDMTENPRLNYSLQDSIDSEVREIVTYLHKIFESKKGIGSISENSTNKLFNLSKAKIAGFSVPDTLITSSRKNLLDFVMVHRKVLTKPISQGGLVYSEEDYRLDGGSVLIDKEFIESLPVEFPSSLFQGYIEKAYELRVFYMHGKCFASAIFSQLDEKTKIDFRNYNFEKPNRTPPYKLPSKIEEQVISFMESVGMDSGSLDIIVTPEKEFVFLEVNPVGQFFQVSYPCNYYLEKKVAEYLSN
ncbi:MAG: grasp-with-spasm system ATP-grasp peptide maturase [Crocinitomicaceae bacterium]|nr:grasp-with-spasm system ATP-grasp peptide maturase [Crocinitomicaceae bacterium]